MSDNIWSYEGKRCVIAGCASGMGLATARELLRLGAELHGADIRPPELPLASFHTVDLRDAQSIDAVVDAIGGEVDAMFGCAGMPNNIDAPVEVMKVNYVGTRHWTERWIPRMKRGGAIALITSAGGFLYRDKLEVLGDLLAIGDFAEAVRWCEGNRDLLGDGYRFSKEATTAYVVRRSTSLVRERGVRINCTMPGPTATPMMESFEKLMKDRLEKAAQPIGRFSTPEEQAYPLVFLNSEAARFVNGVNLAVDGGYTGGYLAGTIE
jgi:NAD(P)-dependent dehydrogenase (short-subunit alcohol dehydrogenase family)